MAQFLLPWCDNDRGRTGQRVQFRFIPSNQEETEQPELLPGDTGTGRCCLPPSDIDCLDRPL